MPWPVTVPLRITASTPPTPIALVAISTCPAAGTGSGRSVTVSPSGLPNVWIVTAFKIGSWSRGNGGRGPGAEEARARRLRTLTDGTVHLAKVREVTAPLPHPLRSDALDNRERILEAARTLLA